MPVTAKAISALFAFENWLSVASRIGHSSTAHHLSSCGVFMHRNCNMNSINEVNDKNDYIRPIYMSNHTGYFKTYTNSYNFKSVCPWHTIILLTYLFRMFMIFLPSIFHILFSEQSACSKNWNNLQPLSRSNQGLSETQLIYHLWICVGFNIAWVNVTSCT